MTLGQKIKKLRTDKGLTQKELSDKVHVTFQTVSKWEKDENEPDVSTLRELSKLFDCSMDYLLSEEEIEPVLEETKEEPVSKTIVIHQKEMHVCERCKKDIPEDELVMEEVCTRHASRGRRAEYRQAYYHKDCLDELHKEREIEKKKIAAAHASSAQKKILIWSIAGGVVALLATLAVLLFVPSVKDIFHPAIAVLISIGAAYVIFADVFCILAGSYISEVFMWCATLSVKFPGLIFSWDLGGFAWLIAMKVLFAILGFLIGVAALFLAIGLSAFLAVFSFPFILVKSIGNGYEDALVD